MKVNLRVAEPSAALEENASHLDNVDEVLALLPAELRVILARDCCGMWSRQSVKLEALIGRLRNRPEQYQAVASSLS